MRFFLIGSLLLIAAAGWSQEEDEEAPKPGRFELMGSLVLGPVLSGDRYDLFTQSLEPTPDRIMEYQLQGGIAVYASEALGWEAHAGFGFLSATQNKSGMSNRYEDRVTPLPVLMTGQLSAGPRLRIVYPLTEWSYWGLTAGVGASLNLAAFTPAYTSLFDDYRFSDLEPGLGYYGRAGGIFYMNGHLFVSGELEYATVSNAASLTHNDFDGQSLLFRMSGGLSF